MGVILIRVRGPLPKDEGTLALSLAFLSTDGFTVKESFF